MAHWEKCLADDTAILKTIVYDGNTAGNIVCWGEAHDRNVGYWLGRKFWGLGIASAALAQFLESVTTRPLFAHVAKSNVASIRVLQKCGFAILRNAKFEDGAGESEEEFIMTINV
jgi:RimJ/RimL family protein N-acetyltransferase